MIPRARDAVMEIAPYVGGESRLEGVNRVIKLSSNEGAFGTPPGAREAYRRAAGELFRYPDGHATELRAALGARFDLDPARMFVCQIVQPGSGAALHRPNDAPFSLQEFSGHRQAKTARCAYKEQVLVRHGEHPSPCTDTKPTGPRVLMRC